ncbi:MAG: class I SAM-dependent methyltransferase [Bacteriovoracaceae bacterium]|nr:class I SAM-dependent methyltransferase [Bacteriovoracaceae bacterium]
MKWFGFAILFLMFDASARKPVPAARLQYLTGAKTQGDTKSKWDERYSKNHFVYGKSPAKFLAENYEYLPYGATVLDIGMGEGRNAVFLAQKGYKVFGVDISSVAVKKARLLAKELGVQIQTVVAAIDDYTIKPASYDAIICFYFVDRKLINEMKTWLKPGGLLIFEAHTVKQRENPAFSDDAIEYFLKEQELPKLFTGMRVLKYEEPIHRKEFRASIILKKI